VNSSFAIARRATLAAGSALGVAALATGCAAGSTGTVTAPPATAPSATSPATTAPAGSSGTPTGSAPGTSAAPGTSSPAGSSSAGQGSGPQPCSSRYLRAGAGLSQGTAGSIYQVITFTNLDNVACTMYGYPGVSLANGTPVTQVGAAADRDTSSSPTTVTLAPQGVASATLRIVDAGNFSPSQCDPVATTWLQIFPPNQYAPLYLSYKSDGCSDSATHLLTISVVVAGNGGSV
jgi:hypothetical protein